MRTILTPLAAALALSLSAGTALGFDRDNNPPGPRGGPGTNWENPPGPVGGPGTSPDRYGRVWLNPPGPVGGPGRGRYYWPKRHYRFDNDNNPPGLRGGPGSNWENPPGPRGGPGTSPNRRYW